MLCCRRAVGSADAYAGHVPGWRPFWQHRDTSVEIPHNAVHRLGADLQFPA